MGWIIERLASNLDTIIGAVDIVSGVRKIFFSVAILSLSVCSGCTFQVKKSQDSIGASTDSYSLIWGEVISEPAPPRQHVSRRRAARVAQEQEVDASPMGAKWFK